MAFSDSDWERAGNGAAPAPGTRTQWAMLAAGAVLGALAASVVWVAIERWRTQNNPVEIIEVTPSSAGAVIPQGDAPASAAVAPATAATATIATPPEAPPSAAASPSPQDLTHTTTTRGDEPLTTAAPARSDSDAALRKERAWALHYQRPKECEVANPSPQLMIECANHHIRARREFDAHYADKKR